ncbi:putative methyltransferase YcgJ [bacterium BMS3Bbin06]|nr:putative methyltransferase YcgJ [bacterium BMS3Bbin06]
MKQLKNDGIRRIVRKSYGKVADSVDAGCGCSPSSCCSAEEVVTVGDVSVVLGYSDEDISSVPEGANMGLGCGNPQAIAALQVGETVLDLGSGGGFDSFLAARAVTEKGYVIGVDMTPEMISQSRKNAAESGLKHVEFRLGEIENLPVADGIVDVIISNCVINLSPDKKRVFKEAFRVLRPGGRLAISDIVASAELPEDVKQDLSLFAGCVSGAASIHELESMLRQAGFENIRIKPKDESREFIRNWAPGRKIEDYVVSATIEANKPMA